MVSVGNLHWGYPLINEIDNIMNVVTWLFLEILSGVQHLPTNVNLYTATKLPFGPNRFGKKNSVQLTDQTKFL